MRRHELEHIIRASAVVADDDEIIVVGSQSILAQFPAPPAELTVSNEADVYPKNHPERADLIDGCIGEGSPFHDTFGYYAKGVGPTTSVLPRGWDSRLVRLHNANTRGAVGLCLEIHDLTVAKAVAGREKDLAYLDAVVPLVDPAILGERLKDTELSPEVRAVVVARLRRRFPSIVA